MTEFLFEKVGWFPLPPVPSPINTSLCAGCQSTDNNWIFVSDGTYGCIFSCQSLTWSNVFSFPYLVGTHNGGVSTGWAMSHVYQGRFILLSLDSSHMFVMNTKGVILSNLSGIFSGGIYSSKYQTYTNGPWSTLFPGGMSVVFYSVYGYPRYVCMTLGSVAGPGNTMSLLLDVLTGLPLYQFQFAGNGQFGELGVDGWNVQNGLPYYIAQTQFVNGDNILTPLQLYTAIEQSVAGNASLTSNGASYNCPYLQFVYQPTYETLNGFFGSVSALGNNIRTAPNFGVQIISGVVNYFGYSMSEDLQTGTFNLPIDIQAPTAIPNGYYNGGYTERPPGMVQNGNVFGYFFSDFSGGYYLGIGQTTYYGFNLLNYTRSDA